MNRLLISSFLWSKAGTASQRENDANSTMQMYSTVPCMSTSPIHFLYAVICIEYHRWKAKKKALLVLAVQFWELSVDILRVSSSVAQSWGLRVHNSVRYNYEKLIPGKARVALYTWCKLRLLHPYTHTLCAQSFHAPRVHTPARWSSCDFGNCPRSSVPLVDC